MTRFLLTHGTLGMFLFLAATSLGCKRLTTSSTANAAPMGSAKDSYDLPIPPEPKLTRAEAEDRDLLLAKFRSKLPLAEPDKVLELEFQATLALNKTFDPGGGWVSPELRKKIDVTDPKCPPPHNGCYVDVTYPDWATFVAVNRALLDQTHVSPFRSFPGPRYRTGRVRRSGKTFLATWILGFQLRYPGEEQTPNQKEAL